VPPPGSKLVKSHIFLAIKDPDESNPCLESFQTPIHSIRISASQRRHYTQRWGHITYIKKPMLVIFLNGSIGATVIHQGSLLRQIPVPPLWGWRSRRSGIIPTNCLKLPSCISQCGRVPILCFPFAMFIGGPWPTLQLASSKTSWSEFPRLQFEPITLTHALDFDFGRTWSARSVRAQPFLHFVRFWHSHRSLFL